MINNKVCTHPRIQGDNYGQTCMDCGKQIAGMGFFGEFPTCLHEWFDDDRDYQECYYCQAIRPRPGIGEVQTIKQLQ